MRISNESHKNLERLLLSKEEETGRTRRRDKPRRKPKKAREGSFLVGIFLSRQGQGLHPNDERVRHVRLTDL